MLMSTNMVVDTSNNAATVAPVDNRAVSKRAWSIEHAGSRRLVSEFFINTYQPNVRTGKDLADFSFGNPHEMPLPGVVEALQKWITPQNPDWFAYKSREPASQQVIADSLSQFLGLPFEPEDITLTTGGFGAIAVALKVVTEPGDEAIFSLPPWFNYEPMSIEAGLIPVKVPMNLETFDLDLNAIAAAITPRTRVLIVNTPCNPTGKVLSPETLTRLATLLDEASERNGRRIFLLSDEAYNRIVFDGIRFHSPLEYYPYSFLAYSYGKTLLMPGQRLGYLAVPPTMPEDVRKELRSAIYSVQAVSGFLFPNALLQHALVDLDRLVPDLEHLTRKRNLMVDKLLDMGYDIHSPEGIFYLFPKSPLSNDRAFTELLLEEDVFVLPGHLFETPGYFRICLTATDEMIERALAGFERAINRVS